MVCWRASLPGTPNLPQRSGGVFGAAPHSPGTRKPVARPYRSGPLTARQDPRDGPGAAPARRARRKTTRPPPTTRGRVAKKSAQLAHRLSQASRKSANSARLCSESAHRIRKCSPLFIRQFSLAATAPTRRASPPVNSPRQPTSTRRGRSSRRRRRRQPWLAAGSEERLRSWPAPLPSASGRYRCRFGTRRGAPRAQGSRAPTDAAARPRRTPPLFKERRAVWNERSGVSPWSQPDRPAPADAAAAKRSRQHRAGRAKRPLGQPPRRSAHPRK